MCKHSITRVVLSLTFAMAAVLTAGPVLPADPEAACQKALYYAAGKYGKCVKVAKGKFYNDDSQEGPSNLAEALSKCRTRYSDTWAKLQGRAIFAGSACDQPRFIVTGGTVTDNLTGLQWEQKTDDGSVHDLDNAYSWTAGSTAASGTAFTSFLATLNGGGCFAGQCDWRLPTLAELLTILSGPYPCEPPCVDSAIFGPTAGSFHWSSTTAAIFATSAWVTGDVGDAATDVKTNANHCRAVRGGL